MNTNQYFSFSRIAMVMKRDLMENWKTNLYRFLGPYAGILLVMILGYWNVTSYASFQSMVLSAFLSVLVVGGVYSASLIMEPMRTQHGRISFLMLPATMLEKFVSRALFMTVGFFLMATLALVLAEATRYLFLPLFDVPESFRQSLLPYVFDELNFFASSDAMTTTNSWYVETEYNILLGQMASVLSLAWIHSFFILGGCYWYKNPFWKTLGMLILANFALGVLFFFFIKWADGLEHEVWERTFRWIENNLDWVTPACLLVFCILLLSILIMLNWWLSYKVFKRSQVIKPKFRLL